MQRNTKISFSSAVNGIPFVWLVQAAIAVAVASSFRHDVTPISAITTTAVAITVRTLRMSPTLPLNSDTLNVT
jgi:hypothetical protein